jgi:tetratricopeptide (TPR) repeat protein
VHPYGVREVQKLLHLPRSTIRMLVDAGFVSPARGPRNAWRFSFQDLIVLRTAQTLAAAKVPARRIARSMKALRAQLPQAMPLSGLSIAAEADRVVVREGARRWQAESGQYLLAFEASAVDGSLRVLERPAASLEEPDAQTYVRRACALQEAGQLAEAETLYRQALEACGENAVLCYNLGIVLEDLERKSDALAMYQRSLAVDPAFADCHYNLALLYEALGKAREAIRHLAEYRRLKKKR